MKITVIATGFDRPSTAGTPTTTQSTTPVDLAHYTRTRTEAPCDVAGCHRDVADDHAAAGHRPAAADGHGRRRRGSGHRAASTSRSPLDVPAFLRRQHEG